MPIISTATGLAPGTATAAGGGILGALGGPIGLIGGALLGGIFGHSANQMAAQQANANRAFQREIAHNAHQWEVQDLLKAGLNPMLSFRGSGAQASGGTGVPSFQNVGMAASSAASSALERQAILAGIAKTNAETMASAAQARETNTRADILGTYGMHQAGEQVGLTSAQSARTRQETENLVAQLPHIAAQIRNLDQKTEESYYETNRIITENRLANLDVNQKQQMMPMMVTILKNDMEKSGLSMAAWRNYGESQDTWWRKMMAWMGFSKEQQEWMVNQALLAPGIMKLPKR